ncbi:hypothetical protein [Natrinema sp. 74]|uniref:hypothetical protein n=1 Tax=Natrinema sp. 74 TaxID=3384159 RepID=UPI0038D4C6B8
MIGALLFAVIVTAVAVVTELVEYVPRVFVPVTDWVVLPWLVLFSAVFALTATVVVGYLLYRRYEDTLTGQWNQLSIWARAIVTGAVCGVAVAVGLGIATAGGIVTPVFVLVGPVIAWPIATVLALRRQRESDTGDDSTSTLQSVLIKSGYAQVKLLQTRTLAGIVGFVGAVLGSTGVLALLAWLPWVDVTLTVLQTVVLAAFLWLVATVLVYNRYESTISDRTDLRIVTVLSTESGDARELLLKNEGVAPIELTRAKIRDTKRDLYQFDGGVALEPGQCRAFEVPGAFLLEPNEAAMDLPLGYTLKQGGEHPIVYTRTGDKFVLRGSSDAPGRDPARAEMPSPVGLGTDPSPQD